MKLAKHIVAGCLSLSALAVFADPVEQINSGHWTGECSTSGDTANSNTVSCPQNIWVDISVENLAFEKEVGIVWTDQGWAEGHVFTTHASYEHALSDGLEQWGVDVTPAGISVSRSGPKLWVTVDADGEPVETSTFEFPVGSGARVIEYAIFYNVNGQTFWDNNSGQNYTIELP